MGSHREPRRGAFPGRSLAERQYDPEMPSGRDGVLPGLALDLLGGFRVRVGGKPVDDDVWRRRRPAAVLKLLALEPSHRLHREQLADLLWPEHDPAAGAANLRKAIFLARAALDDVAEGGAGHLASVGELVRLLGDGLSIDVERFRTSLAAARRERDPAAYVAALALYRGELLPEDRYDEWASVLREELAAEYGSGLAELAALQETAGDLAAALESARRLVAADPLREEGHVAVIRLLGLSGHRSEALQHYGLLARLLDEELGTEPAAETQRLHEEIRSGGDAEPELAADLWERVGDLRVGAGDAAGAVKAFTRALDSSQDRTPRARLLRKTGEAWLQQHRAEEAAVSLAAAEAADSDPAEAARLTRARANLAWETRDLAAAERLAEESLAAAQRDGTEDDIAAAHEARAIVSHFQGRWREGLLEELARLGGADAGASLARVSDLHHCIGQYHLYGDGLHDSVEDYARRVLDLAEAEGMVRAQAFAWCLLGESLLLQARWDEADGCLERSCRLHMSFGSRTGGLPWQRRAELAACTGEHDESRGHLREAAARATVSPMAAHLWGRIHATAAFSAVEQGQWERAVRSVQAALAARTRYGDCPSCSAMLNPIAAEAYGCIGDPESARTYAEAAAGVAQMFASSAWQAMAESAAGSVAVAEGEPERAVRNFTRARELYDAAGQPYWAERTARLASS